MAGSAIGGKKAATTNKTKYGSDFYKEIGAKGGKAQVPKGFALNPKLASEAGRRGGTISKRGKRTATYSEVKTVELKATVSKPALDDVMTSATTHRPSLISKFLRRA